MANPSSRMAVWASVVVATAAVVSLGVGVWNSHRSARAQVQAMALANLQSYLALAVEHPDLASPDESRPVDARYGWFAAYALNTAQTLRALVGHEAGWQRGIDTIVRQHGPYLRSGAFHCEDYDPAFVAYLRQRVADLRCTDPRAVE